MELVNEVARKIGPFVHPTKHLTKMTKLLFRIGLSKFFDGFGYYGVTLPQVVDGGALRMRRIARM